LIPSFKIGRKGLGQVLGDLEKGIMAILWARGEATGREILDEIKSSRDIAFTTVLTVIERLVKKGLVEKTRGESVYIYRPRYTKDEFTKQVSQEVLKGVMEISRGSAIASFVDLLADTDPEELERLSRLIETKRQEMKKTGDK